MNDPRKRRWFQFSLRTLFVVVTLLCVWLGYNLNWIHNRHAFLDANEEINSSQIKGYRMNAGLPDTPPPASLRFFGEKGRLALVLHMEASSVESLTERDRDYIRTANRLFSESKLVISHPPMFVKSLSQDELDRIVKP